MVESRTDRWPLTGMDTPGLLFCGLLLLVGYGLVLAIYRLYFSPLSKFPGPKVAAATAWYEFYYDCIKHGRYTFEVKEMHRKYGPIIRITPWELHIDDPDYYETLYSRTSPRNKYKLFSKMLGNPQALVGLEDHYQHRRLRANMNPFFSMQKVRALEPEIQTLVDKLCARFNDLKGTGTPINTQHAYSCFSTDVISDYALGSGFNYLDAPDFVPDWSDTLSGIAEASAWFKPFPWMLGLLQAAPQGPVAKMNPGMGFMFAYQRRCAVLINTIIEARDRGEKVSVDKFGRATLFHDIVNSDLPPEERGVERLAQEAQATIGAGAETVSKTLAWTTYHLLANPDKLAKMKAELNRLDPDCKAKFVDLEQMPYLTSVMLEGLRLSYGVSGRLQRIAPNEVMQYKEWSIPAGTPVGMSCVLQHHHEEIFPGSYSFNPERWMDPAERRRLEPYMVAFSRGSRQCLGMNLARAELLLALSNVFRKVNFELYQTTKEDVTLQHEIFLPFPKQGSKGVRVVVVDG